MTIVSWGNNCFIFSFLENSALLQRNNSNLPLRSHFLTDKSFSTVKFLSTDILKVIKNLDPNKAHGHDKINIRRLQIREISLCYVKDYLENGTFPSDLKKWNIVPVHEKNIKECVNKYRPVFYHQYVAKFWKDYHLMKC